MKKMMQALIVRFVKGRWGTILPALFKAAAEGGFGEPIKKVYWATAKYKTMIGAVLWGAGAALETVCGQYPQFAWACTYALWPYYAGMFLTAVGLADGGTRSPWPTGTDKADWVVK